MGKNILTTASAPRNERSALKNENRFTNETWKRKVYGKPKTMESQPNTDLRPYIMIVLLRLLELTHSYLTWLDQ